MEHRYYTTDPLDGGDNMIVNTIIKIKIRKWRTQAKCCHSNSLKLSTTYCNVNELSLHLIVSLSNRDDKI